MSAAVVDVSVVLTWCFLDEAREDCDLLQERLAEDGVLVPEHWWLEIANSLLSAERRARIQRSDVEAFLKRLSLMRIEGDHQTREKSWTSTLALARDDRLTAYDAANLELAIRAHCPLATLDRELRVAAQAEGVRLLI